MTLIFSLWLAFNSLASLTTTDAHLSILVESDSPAELKRAMSVNSAIESLATDCAVDLKLKRVPVSCFAESRLRKENGLITINEFDRLTRAFSSACRQVAKSHVDLSALKAAVLSSNISDSCRKAVGRRVGDLDYQTGEVRDLDRFLK